MSAKKVTETAKAEEIVSKETKAAVKTEPAKAEKTPAKKTAAPKKAAVKTTKAAKPAPSQNVYIQFAGKEVKTETLVDQVKAVWVAEGHRVSSIKSLELYVKPEDMAAYYVINSKVEGKIEL